MGEPWTWAVEPDEFTGVLSRKGLTVVDIDQMSDLRDRYLPNRPELTVPAVEYCFDAKQGA